MKFSSFRDPSGRVIFDRDEVIRFVSPSARAVVEEFIALSNTLGWQTKGKLIDSEIADLPGDSAVSVGSSSSTGKTIIKHPRVWFPSYAHEWPAEMLESAGRLTLEMAETLLDKGWGLKDATPFNVLFQGTKPIFIDILSFEKRKAGDPIWLPYQQFVNTFLLPMLINKRCGLPLRTTFLANREGIDVAEASGYFRGVSKFGSATFSLVTLPKMLTKKAESSSGLYSEDRRMEPERANYTVHQSFSRLTKYLDRVSPDPARESKWTGYTKHNVSTIPAYMRAKQEFVENTVSELKPATALDVGCNTGHFSFFAARAGAKVVAIDHDPAVVGQVWRDARRESLDVLPLVVDLSRPSPRIGWRNSEIPSFLDRAEGKFELVMMLAVLHHIIVQERIPLREVLKLAADLTTKHLIIEFVPPTDPLFRRIARGRDHLHADLNTEVFETTAREFFDIVRSQPLPETDRILYLMNKK